MSWEDDYYILKSNHLDQEVPLDKDTERHIDHLMASLQEIWSPLHILMIRYYKVSCIRRRFQFFEVNHDSNCKKKREDKGFNNT